MDERTRTALLASIAHWERMRDDSECGEEPHSRDCPLCRLFYTRDGFCCHGCPVAEKADSPHCGGTPYGAASDAWDDYHDMPLGALDAWREAAQAEIDFLRSLLPREADAHT